jgi:hypothetical protein
MRPVCPFLGRRDLTPEERESGHKLAWSLERRILLALFEVDIGECPPAPAAAELFQAGPLGRCQPRGRRSLGPAVIGKRATRTRPAAMIGVAGSGVRRPLITAEKPEKPVFRGRGLEILTIRS